ncbi:hypothetical protein [Micromonospora taraxaci]
METRFSAFAKGGEPVTLKQILDQVGDPPWHWSLSVFEGTSLADSDLDLIDLERKVERAEEGVEISLQSLRELAGQVDQTINIHLVAKVSFGSSCVFVVQAFDSTEWEIWAEDSDVVAVGVFDRVREGAETGVWRFGFGKGGRQAD